MDRNKQPAKRYQAVQEMTSGGEYTVSETARAAGTSRQAYYKWLNRRLSLREQQER
ncbi:helix-turn-helix domain-containing protein, partial [Limosilactobacillus fermentum]